jgi:pimeloyl-ACP methyl ester carboxylesterase
MHERAKNLEIGSYRFACVERGEGSPVLFVHGSVSDYRTWLPQLEVFGKRYRAIAYSRRYHWPNAPIPDGADYSMTQHVADLAALIKELAVAPIQLVGHSYGAFLCLLLAIRQPDLVRSLVLAEPPAVTLFVSNKPTLPELLWLLATRPGTAAAVLKFGIRGLAPATRTMRAGRSDEALRIFGTAVLGAEIFGKLSTARMRQVHENLIAAEFVGSGFAPLRSAWVKDIRIPVLLLSGAGSPALFHRIIERLHALLPESRHIDIRGASHIVHEDNAPAFNQALATFLVEASQNSRSCPG